jgi:hypothetical protein
MRSSDPPCQPQPLQQVLEPYGRSRPGLVPPPQPGGNGLDRSTSSDAEEVLHRNRTPMRSRDTPHDRRQVALRDAQG